VTFENLANSDAIREAGGIRWLILLLTARHAHPVAIDAAATLAQICVGNPTNQDAIHEAGGTRSLIGFLSADVKSQGLIWAARGLANLSRDNSTNRTYISEQQGVIARLVDLLSVGPTSEGAHCAADVLRCLMTGHDDRVAVAVLAALRRQGVGLGPDATFALSEAFPELLQGLAHAVEMRLAASMKRGTDRALVQMALNDAFSLGMPEEMLSQAQQWLDSMEAARAEAIAARKLLARVKKDANKKGGKKAGDKDRAAGPESPSKAEMDGSHGSRGDEQSTRQPPHDEQQGAPGENPKDSDAMEGGAGEDAGEDAGEESVQERNKGRVKDGRTKDGGSKDGGSKDGGSKDGGSGTGLQQTQPNVASSAALTALLESQQRLAAELASLQLAAAAAQRAARVAAKERKERSRSGHAITPSQRRERLATTVAARSTRRGSVESANTSDDLHSQVGDESFTLPSSPEKISPGAQTFLSGI
jgi:hypothetical protein